MKEIIIDGVEYTLTPKVKEDELDEAIAELEELQNRSCEGCVYYLSANGNFPLSCLDCSRFCADKYKKENK